MVRKRMDLTGQRFGKLVVQGPGKPNKWNQSTCVCLCDCGNTKVVTLNGLRCHNTTSCGCFQKSQARKAHLLRPYESLYNRLCDRVKKQTVEITYNEFVEFTKINECFYCGAEVFWCVENTKINGTACNLDRKDNTKGYSIENCVVCCTRCNRCRMDKFTHEEWIKIGNEIRSWKTSS